MTVTQLVRKAKKGNKEALLQLVMAQQADYYKLAYTYMGNKHDALDVMEDMIVIIYEKINSLKKPESFYSWSKTILVNCCRSSLRKRSKVILVEDWNDNNAYQTAKKNVVNPYLSSEQQIDLQQLLAQLNPKQEETIKLRYFQDMDYQTIADLMNVSLGTVKSRIFQGLKKLKQLSGGDEHE